MDYRLSKQLKIAIQEVMKFFLIAFVEIMALTLLFILVNNHPQQLKNLHDYINNTSWSKIFFNNYIIFLIIIISGFVSHKFPALIFEVILIKFFFLYLISLSLYSFNSVIETLVMFAPLEIMGYAISVYLGKDTPFYSKEHYILLTHCFFLVSGTTLLLFSAIIEKGVISH